MDMDRFSNKFKAEWERWRNDITSIPLAEKYGFVALSRASLARGGGESDRDILDVLEKSFTNEEWLRAGISAKDAMEAARAIDPSLFPNLKENP